ncbi:hypothetical protein ACFUJR_20775 [Streptomyces sp. NPDC057271]|uniref:hypothetical protein n=1 Tax=unclassified Streptomyces TaxID=2593676 RepID=UPI00363F0230
MTTVDLSARESAITLLAGGMSSNDVGTTIGVSGRTVRRWRQEPDFKAEVESARRELLAESIGAVTSALRRSIATLEDLMGNESAAIRVKAAGDVLRMLPALGTHAELEERLAALEARLADPPKEGGRSGLTIA